MVARRSSHSALSAALLAVLLAASVSSLNEVLTKAVPLAAPWLSGPLADIKVCFVANACCLNNVSGFFIRLARPTDAYDCQPVHMAATDAFQRSVRFQPWTQPAEGPVTWSDKLALVFERFWPENAALTLHNDVVSLLVTWHRVASLLGNDTLPPLAPRAAQAITLDTHSGIHNRMRHVYDELLLGGLLQPSAFPAETLCFTTCIVGSGVFNFNGAGGISSLRTTPDDMDAVKSYFRSALALPLNAPRTAVRRVSYLPRTISRRVVNLDELLAGIASERFEVRVVHELECSSCTLREQLAAVWDADVVISMHGAQLAYAAFTDAEAVIEIMPYGFRKEAFYVASAVARMEHYQVHTVVGDTQLNLSALPSFLRREVEEVRLQNITLYKLVVEQHVCPGHWSALCRAGIMHQDSRVDVGKMVWLLDMIRQRAHKYSNSRLRMDACR